MDWIDKDIDITTLNQCAQCLEGSGSIMTLKKAFLQRMAFGTAGLRSRMGPGDGCMNLLTVAQTTQGIAKYLLNVFGAEECANRGAVVGYDGRYNSESYAHITAAALKVAGFKVYLNSKVTATPLTPYCVVKKRCVIGIHVTASHNPKEDNGYKVYAANGAQIKPPVDAEIASAIQSDLGVWSQIKEYFSFDSRKLINMNAICIDPYDEVLAMYLGHMSSSLCKDKQLVAASNYKVVYTAMHGVGYIFVEALLEKFGFSTSRLMAVPVQRDPDPEFSTVSFPNPEEKGALDIALACAKENSCRMVIANDPDADRFAAAELTDCGDAWNVFTGDELGIILAHRCMELAGRSGVIDKSKMLFVCSAVSSRMLSRMCAAEGCRFEETATGFKWMMNKALELQQSEGLHPVFVYEEALGYAVDPTQVPDKDGITAAAVWVELMCELASKGRTVNGYLTELKIKYGYFVTSNSYVICHSQSTIKRVFDGFRNSGDYPTSVGGYALKRIRDVTTGYDSGEPNNVCAFAKTPDAQMITLFYENGVVITLRTSGTEPKVKWYSEVSGTTADEASKLLHPVVSACVESILNPNGNGMQSAH
eukprot:Lankesteria_metandrocarpae@DN2148_c0_g1_i1.p1